MLAPLSSADKPKQFHALAHDELSLLQQTALRVKDERHFAPLVLFGNIRHEDHIKEQLAVIGCTPSTMFLEPLMRNTAAPVLLSALHANRNGFEQVLILPSDHCIYDREAFCCDIHMASKDEAVISYFGIAPDRPYSGYGYIQETSDGIVFHEKPVMDKAVLLILEGALWNSGIFLLHVSSFLETAARIMPDFLEAISNKGLESYTCIPDISFDKAFCEHTSLGRLHKANFDWADLGSWEALASLEMKEGAA